MEFCSTFTHYFADLSDSLKSQQVEVVSWQPSSFALDDNVHQTLNTAPNPGQIQSQPVSAGCPAIANAFVSSLNFSDGQRGERLFPANSSAVVSDSMMRCGTTGPDGVLKTEITGKHILTIEMLGVPFGHFCEFQEGLGLLDQQSGCSVHLDESHQIYFTGAARGTSPGLICWMDELGPDPASLIASYFSGHDFRVEIKSCSNGLFHVRIRIHGRYGEDLGNLEEFLVSKKALSIFVVGQVHLLMHVIDERKRSVVNPLRINSDRLKAQRERDFFSESCFLAGAKTLFERT
jgi:hypothetical protein